MIIGHLNLTDNTSMTVHLAWKEFEILKFAVSVYGVNPQCVGTIKRVKQISEYIKKQSVKCVIYLNIWYSALSCMFHSAGFLKKWDILTFIHFLHLIVLIFHQDKTDTDCYIGTLPCFQLTEL